MNINVASSASYRADVLTMLLFKLYFINISTIFYFTCQIFSSFSSEDTKSADSVKLFVCRWKID